MTVLEFIGTAIDFHNYFLRYFQGKTLEYYNLQSANWYGILENLGYGVKLNPIYQDKEFLELGMTIYTNYYKKWEHLAALFLAEYNPIENYSMVEDMLDYTEHGKTDEHYENYSDTTNGHSVGGANVRNGKIVTAVSADSTGGNITNIEMQPNSITGHKGTRSGNIGVTTTQQMAMSEIDYANYIVLAKIICSDVIEFISAGVYECDG